MDTHFDSDYGIEKILKILKSIKIYRKVFKVVLDVKIRSYAKRVIKT